MSVHLNKKWTICDFIGNGHHGKVYKVKRKTKFYALKVQNDEKLYRRELSFLHILKKSNFVPILFDYWVHKNKYHFVTELLSEYTNLSNIEIYTQLKNILSYLHERRIVFFDLHHHNVLFKQNRVYLIDFALAYLFSNYTEQITNCYGNFTLKSGKEVDILFLKYYWGNKRISDNASKIIDNLSLIEYHSTKK